uniref:Dienelactone hydrolase domain-containing protein n=1 Tax=Minutocellus polymorphus TaxID=265543 RepID=A0A6U4KC65_9STRA|mmetsp:Transcript_18662/g.30990  ORF Transcript_18662/g.30990 Transcript_18662/m.30990 type:complete len:291 (+) Transcript_18662:167-1039(+)|eukprot:CAMPEP_0197726916 /NCGR_PEP_ID=MMETSP1434-20131217/17682_1 /TAXON_ID=265543 /ORGANISM="Minutocellus polymorphus, Strain CCMP3303" /LENGTH=290 /DNA_ID=CAMNT_0043312971 /DNA_START=167 /DNA_END=1039 /DNA_ORIENTATION=-
MLMHSSFPFVLAVSLLGKPVGSFSSLSPPPAHNKWASSAAHLMDHLLNPPLQAATPLEDLANVRIPGPPGSGFDIAAYRAAPSSGGDGGDHKIILLHEFFGLNPSIVEKAKGLADDLGCEVVAPDIFRGENTDFIPKAIWLALTTPQERVDEDLDAVCAYLDNAGDEGKLAVMGFCLGGGKAIRYTTERRPEAATVIFYGSPLTDVNKLRKLKGPVCGIFGNKDAQFSAALLQQFKASLNEAGVESDVQIYDGVGHAFWAGMEQVRRGEQPQTDAYEQCTSFLRKFFSEE